MTVANNKPPEKIENAGTSNNPSTTLEDIDFPDDDADASDAVFKESSNSSMELFYSELEKIAKLGKEYEFDFTSSNLFEHIKNIIERSYLLRRGLSKIDNFLTMTEMEKILSENFTRQHKLSIADFLQDLQNIKA
jgi:hypothetical protein